MDDNTKSFLTTTAGIVLIFGLGFGAGVLYDNQRWNYKIASAPADTVYYERTIQPPPVHIEAPAEKPPVHSDTHPVLDPSEGNVVTDSGDSVTIAKAEYENLRDSAKAEIKPPPPGLAYLVMSFYPPTRKFGVDYQLAPIKSDSTVITKTVLREPTLGEYLQSGLFVGGAVYVVAKIVYFLATGKFSLP